MNNDNGKRGGASKTSVTHGVQESRLHWIHSKESKQRQTVAYVAHEVIDGTDYPKFKSDLSGLGSGRNWIMEDGELKIVQGEKWIDKMLQIIDDCSWYHQRMRATIKKGDHEGKRKVRYARRNMNDRSVMSETDRRSRPDTDLMRETIDLRPDHSRVLQFLVECGRKNDLLPVLDEIQQHQIGLLEDIYEGRIVVSDGEHVDSGQYHYDHWHHGIKECKVSDHGAVVELVEDGPDKDKGEKVLVDGNEETFRLRTPFSSYGVSDGMASFDRHRSALESDGRNAKTIMGFTHERLLFNIDLVKDRNKKRLQKKRGAEASIQDQDIMPRDIRMWRHVDEFVDSKLRELDPGLCDKARKEYADWIQNGYELEKLGIRKESLQVTKHKKRKHELEKLKAAVRAFLEIIIKIPAVGDFLLNNKDSVISKKFNELAEMVAPEKEEDMAPKPKARKNIDEQTMDMN